MEYSAVSFPLQSRSWLITVINRYTNDETLGTRKIAYIKKYGLLCVLDYVILQALRLHLQPVTLLATYQTVSGAPAEVDTMEMNKAPYLSV